MFHDEAGGLVKDFGSPELQSHRLLADKESLAESLRLLYVALTRAKYRCYLFSGKTRSESSPVNYLLHASTETRAADNQAVALAAESKTLTAAMMVEELQSLADSSEGSIGFQMMTREDVDNMTALSRKSTAAGSESAVLRTFSGTLDTIWRVSSQQFDSAVKDVINAELSGYDISRTYNPSPNGPTEFGDQGMNRLYPFASRLEGVESEEICNLGQSVLQQNALEIEE